jgi:cytoskeletal protein CcmA (bactofilin family)
MSSKGTGSIATLLGKDTEIKGHVSGKGTIRVDGRVEGNVVSTDGVIIGEFAVIKGNVEGKHVVIGGKVTGDVRASVKLELLHTGRLYGDIKTPKIAMAEGVVFEGVVDMQYGGAQEKK